MTINVLSGVSGHLGHNAQLLVGKESEQGKELVMGLPLDFHLKGEYRLNKKNFKVLIYLRLIGGELPCPGAPEERESCEAGPCPAWTEWTQWTECSQSCGGGTRTKVRECASGRNYEGCVGESEVTEDCNEQKCPAWTDWTEWTVCTKSCGGGKRSKVCLKL